LLIATLLIALPVCLTAATPAGNLVVNKGMAKLRRNNLDSVYPQSEQAIPVYSLDEIQTGADSSATITLEAKDDSIELFSQSFFKIERADEQESETSMSIGKAHFKIKKDAQPLAGKTRFKLKTANAIVGVKGTEFVVGTGTEVTNILTLEGAVDVASVSAPEVTVEVGENQVSQVKPESTPTAPVAVPPTVRDSILTTDSPAAFSNGQFGASVPDTAPKEQSQKKEEPKPATGTEKKEESKETQSEPAKSETPKESTPAGGEATSSDGSSPDSEGSTEEPAAAESTDTGEDGLAAENTESVEVDLEDDEVIDLELIDTDEMAELDIEEPEIDLEDLFDIDSITQEVAETAEAVTEEIEDIQRELVEEETERTVRIQITHE